MPRNRKVDLKDAVEMIQAALEQLYVDQKLSLEQFEERWHQEMTNIAYLFTPNDLVYYYLFLDAISMILTGNEDEDIRAVSDFVIRCLFLAYYTQPDGYGPVPEVVLECLVPIPPPNAPRGKHPIKISQNAHSQLLSGPEEEAHILISTLKEEGGLLISELPLMESGIINKELKTMIMGRGREERILEATRKIGNMQIEEEALDLRRTLKEELEKVQKVEKDFWSSGTHPYVIQDLSSQINAKLKK